MTSATYARDAARRRRCAAVAVGLVAALALTACTSDDSGGSGDSADTADSTSSATPTASGSGSASAGTGDAPSVAGELEGSWAGTTQKGKVVALVITGAQAALFSTDGSVCSGTAGESDGDRVISLKCTDDSDGTSDRASGTVDSVDTTTLKVTWKGAFGEETYTKAEGGKLPSGLPTAGLGQ
ncbi:hypothetical protein ACIQAC_11135 [Streptomyces sp. NPDC088387]|uniref:hypothetical protein n=1 Tax=Streptomyces sp. NPDC088387 TaxID=3365859 RepID=UPI00382689E2